LLIVSVGAAAWFFGGQPGTADIIAAMPTLPMNKSGKNKSATDLEQISAAQPAQTQSVKEPSIEEAETEAVLTQQEVAQAPVQPSTPEPETKVYDQVTRPKNQTQVHTEQQAFSELYSAWGAVYTAPNMTTPCDYAKMVSLQCLNRKGTWSDVEQLDLPVVLELWDTENRPFYAALLGSKGDELTLVVSETTLITTARHLRNLWFGSYVALWHVPTKNRKELKLGDTDPSVVWLRSSLSKEFGRSFTSENEEVYDETVRDAILQFQQSLGLNTDGIVGPETWVELQNRHRLERPGLTT
jgi:general secretion pathway protein A